MNKYFLVKSEDDRFNNLILELQSDVDLNYIQSVITDEIEFDVIHFKVVFDGYTSSFVKLENQILLITKFSLYSLKLTDLILLDHITHLPNTDTNIWIDYTESKLRYKLYYDIKLLDDTIIEKCYPNANEFMYCGNNFERMKTVFFKDDEIKEIRLSKDNSVSDIEDNFEVFSYFILKDKEGLLKCQ